MWKVFQIVWESEEFPEVWSRGLIFPLYKGGPEEGKLDTNKYRGITLLSVIGKIYTMILNDRLSEWAESNGIFVDEQAGFRKSRSTTDQLFILLEIIRSRRPAPTFVAFLDVAKAYDRVYRNGLWYKIWKLGLKGKIWRVLKNIYKKVESSVLLGERRTEWFTIEVGLRQGCILSPILFLLFINDLKMVVDKLNRGVFVGDRKVSILFFADDIAILSESKEDLEFMLGHVYVYSTFWRFRFNLDKCGVIIFHYQSRPAIIYGNCTQVCHCNHHFKFGPFLINEVLVYKYLGVDLDYRLIFGEFKNKILAKAKSNLSRIWNMGIKEGVLSIKASINLYQTLVLSGLEYSSQLWGFDLWEFGEQIQFSFIRYILHCSIKTSKPALVGETGLMSLFGRRSYKKFIYWFDLINLPNDRLLKHLYLISKQQSNNKNNWYKNMNKLFKKYGLQHLWNDPDLIYNLDNKYNNNSPTLLHHKEHFKVYIKKIILHYEEKEWKILIKDDNNYSKLRTYRIFKTNLRLEHYLMVKSNKIGRYIHTSLRTGSNKLAIDLERRNNVDTGIVNNVIII